MTSGQVGLLKNFQSKEEVGAGGDSGKRTIFGVRGFEFKCGL